MGAGERLRDLDSRVLPLLVRHLSRLGRGPVRARWPVGVVLLSVVAVLVTAVWAVGRGPSGGPTTPPLMRVGAVEGQPVSGYVRSSRGELTALLGRSAAAETYALISFTAYVAPQRLAELLPGAAVSQVYVRAPLRGIQTQVLRIAVHRVPDDVLAGMLDAAGRREQERSEFVRLGVALGAGGHEQRLHRAYDTAAQVAAAEAQAYRAGCPCVFAAVVHAAPVTLQRIASEAEVRAVDPAPEVHALDAVEFRPPLPEQQTGGSGPPEDPTPSVPGGMPPSPVADAASASAAGTGPPAVTSASPSDHDAAPGASRSASGR